MLKWIARRRLAAFERAFNYDTAYMREMLDTSWSAFMRFAPVMKMANHREGAPLDAWYAAKIVALMHEDCGPCTQLVVTMAEQEGVSQKTLRAVLDNDTKAMGADVELAVRYTRAVLAHDAEANALREQVVARWGKPGLMSMALGIAASRVFPTVKYATGHGQACVRVRVGGDVARIAVPLMRGSAA